MMNIFKKNKANQLNKGMTYVELIVVLSIFSSLSAVVIFNYNAFQSRIDIKNLSNDIALKIVEAQKFSVSGRLPPFPQRGVTDANPSWKPSYGIYIDHKPSNSFDFFVDIDQSCDPNVSSDPVCMDVNGGESLDPILLTKGNTISELSFFNRGDSNPSSLDDLTIAFMRPSGSAILRSTTPSFVPNNVDYVQISVLSPKGATANIKIYSSGNIDIR